jgi:glycerate kinase
MKVLIAPNAFKNCLNSLAVTSCIASGIKHTAAHVEILERPLADGGEGTLRIITKALDAKCITKEISGPSGDMISADYSIAPRNNTAVIELAAAAGLALLPEKNRDPLRTSTIGVGELIIDGLEKGCKKIILGIGDSSTIDCGIGALSVLGIRFLDQRSKPIALNCLGLKDLCEIDTSRMQGIVSDLDITVGADVRNILTGNTGALLFARQKGATPESMGEIDKALKNFKRIVLEQYGVDLDHIPGSGAAGGIGGSFAALLKARLIPGFDLINDITGFEAAVKSCDIVITGEGCLDAKSLFGKATERVLVMAATHKRPVILVCGQITLGTRYLSKYGVRHKYEVTELTGSVGEAIDRAPELLTKIGAQIGEHF